MIYVWYDLLSTIWCIFTAELRTSQWNRIADEWIIVLKNNIFIIYVYTCWKIDLAGSYLLECPINIREGKNTLNTI